MSLLGCWHPGVGHSQPTLVLPPTCWGRQAGLSKGPAHLAACVHECTSNCTSALVQCGQQMLRRPAFPFIRNLGEHCSLYEDSPIPILRSKVIQVLLRRVLRSCCVIPVHGNETSWPTCCCAEPFAIVCCAAGGSGVGGRCGSAQHLAPAAQAAAPPQPGRAPGTHPELVASQLKCTCTVRQLTWRRQAKCSLPRAWQLVSFLPYFKPKDHVFSTAAGHGSERGV